MCTQAKTSFLNHGAWARISGEGPWDPYGGGGHYHLYPIRYLSIKMKGTGGGTSVSTSKLCFKVITSNHSRDLQFAGMIAKGPMTLMLPLKII